MIRLRPTKTALENIRNVTSSEHFFLKGLRDALFDVGQLAALEASVMINNDGRTGQVYLINGVHHQSSAPGEAPANLSGRLKKSMDYQVHGYDEVQWGSTVDYGKWLETGTKKMAPRPYLAKVHEKHGRDAQIYFARRVDDALKRRR